MPIDKQAIAEELLRRGVSPDELAKAGYGQIAQQGRTGLIAPKMDFGDPAGERQTARDDYKELGKRRAQTNTYSGVNSALDRFQSLNERTNTGGIMNGPVGSKRSGLISMMDPKVGEMDAITSGLQGKARPAGSGATSDFEQRLYRQGVPSSDKAGPVNASIRTYMKSVLSEDSDRVAFEDEYFRKNRNLANSAEAWTRYVSAHPYAMTDSKGNYVKNPKRADWRQYFGISGGGSASANAMVAAPAGRSAPGRAAPRNNDPLGIR